MRLFSTGLALATLTTLPAAVAAAPINAAASGLASPDTIVTFSEVSLPNSSSVTNQYAAFGVTFSPQMTYASSISARPNFSGASGLNFGGGATFDPFSIKFTANVSEAAFNYTKNSGTAIFTALLDGTAVESFTSPVAALPVATNPNNFFGFTGIIFNEIRVAANTGVATSAIDNIAFTLAPPAIPLPAGLPLALGAFGALAALRRRQR